VVKRRLRSKELQEQMRSLIRVREAGTSTLFGRGHPQHVTNRAENALIELRAFTPELMQTVQTSMDVLAGMRAQFQKVRRLADEVTAYAASIPLDGAQDANDPDLNILKDSMDDLQECVRMFEVRFEKRVEKLKTFRDDVARDLLRHTELALAAMQRIQQKV
jgi:hypothetical protein